MVFKSSSMMDAYSLLKAQVIESFKEQHTEADVLKKLLPYCEPLIESRRTVEQIRESSDKLNDLFAVLERRDELSNDDVTILFELANVSGVMHVQNLALQYMKLEKCSNRCKICNFSKCDTAPIRVQSPAQVAKKLQAMEKYHDLSDDETPAIDDAIAMIAPNVGRKWTDIARSLRLTEEDIDAIVDENRRLIDKIHATFKIWKENVGKQATIPVLRRALERSRRRDLSDMLAKHFD